MIAESSSSARTLTVLYADHCRNWPLAAERVREAQRRVAGPVNVVWRPVHDAAVAGFAGSPTFLLDGVDPFPAPPSVHDLCCRFYDTPDGRQPAPSLGQLVAVLDQPLAAAARGSATSS